MGLLDGFLGNKKKQSEDFTDWLYEKADSLGCENIQKLTTYIFKVWGSGATGLLLIKNTLIPGINKHSGVAWIPENQKEVEEWLEEVFEVTTPENQKAILVTAAFDVYQHSVLSASQIMKAIEETIERMNREEILNE